MRWKGTIPNNFPLNHFHLTVNTTVKNIQLFTVWLLLHLQRPAALQPPPPPPKILQHQSVTHQSNYLMNITNNKATTQFCTPTTVASSSTYKQSSIIHHPTKKKNYLLFSHNSAALSLTFTFNSQFVLSQSRTTSRPPETDYTNLLHRFSSFS